MPGIPLVLATFAIGLALVATPAFAYIGPGAGLTVLGALWGVVVAIVLALGAILLWPIRVVLRRRRRASRSPAAPVSQDAAPDADLSTSREDAKA